MSFQDDDEFWGWCVEGCDEDKPRLELIYSFLCNHIFKCMYYILKLVSNYFSWSQIRNINGAKLSSFRTRSPDKIIYYMK